MNTKMEQQFRSLKSKHPDALLLFRCGDFYETYHEDAENAANVLGITVTTKDNTRFAGFPHHALDTYLPRLIRAGHRVAICDQFEEKPTAKALISRGDEPKPKKVTKPKKVKLPSLTQKQYELLCECIRYRSADNQAERAEAIKRGHFTLWYNDLDQQLNELKTLLYNLK